VSSLFLTCGFACAVYGLAKCFSAILFSELNVNLKDLGLFKNQLAKALRTTMEWFC